MRRVLVDHARTRDARKRGDGDYKVALDENIAAPRRPKSIWWISIARWTR